MKLEYVHRKPQGSVSEDFNVKHAELTKKFHETMTGYEETPLIRLDKLSQFLNVKGIFIKDEAPRFGLNSFKGLGGSYCLFRKLSEKLGAADLKTFEELRRLVRDSHSDLTVISATDGNHGRGLAWMCSLLGLRCVILLPGGSSEERFENIRKLGADVSRTDVNYDKTVEEALRLSKENGWLMVQDTALEGMEDVAVLIMQGYLTMAFEAAAQLGQDKPTHIFLQAGVGSMAGSLCAFFSSLYVDNPPAITIVEPKSADCVYETARINDGDLHTATGDLETIMAGLSCGVPCSVGWNQIKATASHFLRIEESVAATGVRVLSSPLEGDKRVLAGESGASAFGAAFELLSGKKEYANICEQMGLNEESKILFFNTEGITDRRSFLQIVWDGKYPR